MRLFRARVVWLFGIGLALVGLLPVLYFLALVAWQFGTHVQAGSWVALPATLAFTDHSVLQAGKVAPVLAFLPEFPSAWLMNTEAWPPVHKALMWILDRLHIGLVFTVIGLVLMALGALIALRQTAIVRTAKRLREDRLRRVRLRQYSEDSERLEPFIGPGILTGNIADPTAKKEEAA
jgi:hypothetical protein